MLCVLSVYVLFCVCCVFYCIVLCIVVQLPPGTYPLAVNNNSNKNNNIAKGFDFKMETSVLLIVAVLTLIFKFARGLLLI